ncbi:DHA2 family efflux MFS transporter permease subunit [Sporosarcina sp. E16_3]|uniref:DHA2 family efflux MFS transporter permease subunit n=1 Tax=Sporosarcina sp. E16_3 TaxID=2789293 RepID=UPI001A917216|nr:DHA2 family efflux MFS transporter permease subunit [Sporosarcina sp. E16_3]MBO0603383.1 DHA2 family efflux MFS transporter permease subunit [Sporosarcina sp. E16_3]
MESHLQVKNPKLMAAVLMIGSFIGLFGETALNMALTDIMEDFSINAGTAQWLTTGYLLVLAISVPLSVYLVRWFTTRQLIVGALIISTMGALLAAIAPSFSILLIGRLIQAIGTGVFLPLMFSVVLLIFPIQKRGAVMGIVGLVITTGPALGPTLSGLIISAASWHYIFWVMMALNIILFAIGAPNMENVSDISKPKIDVLSLLLSTIAFGGIVYALATLAELPLSDVKVWAPLVAGVLALILFTVRQLKMEVPMINLRVFKYPMFALGTVLMFATLFVVLFVAILIPLYLKSVLAYTSIAAGLLMLPANVLNIIMAPIVGSNFNKVGARVFTRIGFALITIGAIMFIVILSATTPIWQVIVALSILFLGVSMTIMPAQTNAMNQLPAQLYTDGSAAMNTLTQVAGAAGTAIAITLFTAGQNNYIAEFGAANPTEFLAHGINYAFYAVLVTGVIGLIGSLFVKNSRPIVK